MAKKMTKKDYFAILKASYPTDAANYNEVIGFIDHELELLAKKNSTEKKPTAQQVANEAYKTSIVEGMERNKLYQVTDLIKSVPAIGDLTNQRVSALLRQLIDEGKVVRTEDKRKAFFSLA